MSDDRIVSCLGSFAEILSDPRGYEPERLKGLSTDAPDLVSSFIQATLSSNETAIQQKLNELADHASGISSFQAWISLAVLAQHLFFHQSAIEYYQRSIRLAEDLGNNNDLSRALHGLGSLYAEEEDWDRASQCYEKALKCLEDAGEASSAVPVLRSLGEVYRLRGDCDGAMQCYRSVLDKLDAEDRSGLAEALGSMGRVSQLQATW